MNLPKLVAERPITNQGSNLSCLKVHVVDQIVVVEHRNCIYVIDGDGNWREYAYDALSDMLVTCDEKASFVGPDALSYLYTRFLDPLLGHGNRKVNP